MLIGRFQPLLLVEPLPLPVAMPIMYLPQSGLKPAEFTVSLK